MGGQRPDQALILVIESDQDVIDQLALYFGGSGMALAVATSAEEGLQQAFARRPSIVLLGASVGEVDGVAVYRQLRGSPLTAHIPIMFIADYRHAKRRNQLLAEGADDVIMRPFDVEILGLRVRNAIQRTRREGLIDPLTGLPTGSLVEEKIKAMGQRAGWCQIGLRIAHFDAFRAGYDFISGNEVLRYAASAINEVVRELGGEEDFVGHAGEARFVVLTRREGAQALIQALQARLDEGLQQFYSFMEREQGYLLVEDGRGGSAQRPLMRLEAEIKSA